MEKGKIRGSRGRGHKTGRDLTDGRLFENNENIRDTGHRRNNYGHSVETNASRGGYQNPMNHRMNGRGDEVANRFGYNSHRGGIESYRNSHSVLFGPYLQGFIGFVAEPGLRKLGIQEAYRILDEYTSTAGDKVNSDIKIAEEGDDKVDIKCDGRPLTPSMVENINNNEEIVETCLVTGQTQQKLDDKSVEIEDLYHSSFPRNYSYISLTTAVDTVIFVNSRKGRASPAYFISKIYEDLLSGICKGKKFKFLDRFFPVNETLPASGCDDIISAMKKLLVDNFPHTGYVSFNVECNIHDRPDGSKFWRWKKEEMSVLLEHTVCNINPDAYISLYQPSYLICIHVVNSVACLSVLPNAAKYHLYSLEEFRK